MRTANAVAWAVIAVLIAGALAMASVLGFVGLIILGAGVAFICSDAEAAELQPPYVAMARTEIRAPDSTHQTPEQNAAQAEARRAITRPYRFYKRCGLFVLAVGIAGFIWQVWFPAALS